MPMSLTAPIRRFGLCLALSGLLAGCATDGFEPDASVSTEPSTAQTTPVRPHAYAFDRPELFSAQRTFGVGYAITLLGDACVNDAAASESYSNWQDENMTVLQQLSVRLAEYYRINIDATQPGLQRRRVAQAMHLRTSMALSNSSLATACASLPETLALPHMNLARRYQITLTEAQRPDFLRPRRRVLPTGNPDKVDSQNNAAQTPGSPSPMIEPTPAEAVLQPAQVGCAACARRATPMPAETPEANTSPAESSR